jgi:protocatechuate 3,4-dioxygenase beta subunit
VRTLLLLTGLLAPSILASQMRPDLYQCEGCEAIHEHPFDNLSWRAVIPPPGEPGEPMIVRGVVYRPDGKTPAPDVVIYVHHTNARGIYPTTGTEAGWGRRHGYLRGWVKTNAAGEYRFETVRPGTYPSRTDPAHVHITVKEPGRREYWIDEIVFTDDSLVTARYRDRVQNRGGSGIVTPSRDESGTWIVRRDVVLER